MTGVRLRHIRWLLAVGALTALTGILHARAYGQATMPGPDPTFAPPAAPGPELSYPAGPNEELFAPAPDAQPMVVEVRVAGDDTVDPQQVYRQLRTRAHQPLDPQALTQDAQRLMRSGLFQNVVPHTLPVEGGVIVTFEVFKRPTIRYIDYVGNRRLSDKQLARQTGLKVGDSLNLYSVQEARRKLEEYYLTKGFARAQVLVLKGEQPEDQGVVFWICEGEKERIWDVEFYGNELVSDARLETRIQSKPGLLWPVLANKVDPKKIDEDIERLTDYYRRLGYFRAKVGRELIYNESGDWLTIRFVIDEGPRYTIRDITINGNHKFTDEELLSQLQLKPGEFFNQDRMQRDENTLSDMYGGEGHVMARIKADPIFEEDAPELSLVYNIVEGAVFAVGSINVHMEGDFPHTKESVIYNRLGLRPGDIIDIREVRRSERRLKASQLFEVDPSQGIEPQIIIRPPDLTEPDIRR